MDAVTSVRSETMCNWFQFFFYVNGAVAVIVGMVFLWSLFQSSSSLPKGLMSLRLFFSLIGTVIATTNMLFFYLICDRALLKQAA